MELDRRGLGRLTGTHAQVEHLDHHREGHRRVDVALRHVVAEGVETPEQLALLRLFGCDQAQGYLISKPLPLPELVEYLTFGKSQQALLG